MLLNFVKIFLRTDIAMPEIFRKFGYRFSFYSNEHLPIHVHVRKADGEAKFEIKNNVSVQLVSSYGLKLPELAKAQSLVEKNIELIIDTWIKYFNK